MVVTVETEPKFGNFSVIRTVRVVWNSIFLMIIISELVKLMNVILISAGVVDFDAYCPSPLASLFPKGGSLKPKGANCGKIIISSSKF